MRIPKDLHERTQLFLRALIHYVIDQPIVDRDGLKELINSELQVQEMPEFARGSEQVKLAASRVFKRLLVQPLDWNFVQIECQDLYQRLDDAAVQRLLAWLATKYPIPIGGVFVSGAACQACVVNVGKLRVGTGEVGEPFGACNNCSSFACGYHGTRDGNVPQFICIECDPNLLCASAAATVSGVASGGLPVVPENPLLLEMLRGYRLSWLPREYWAVRSVREFSEQRPGYDRNIFEQASARSRDIRSLEGDLDIVWRSLPNDAREMLALAALITLWMEIPEKHLGPLMLMLRKSLG